MTGRPHRMRADRGCAVLLLGCSLAPGLVFAHGLRNPPAGAAAAAVDGGKAALVSDATAITHNPANLVEVPGEELLATATLIHGQAEYVSPEGGFDHTRQPWVILPNLYAAWPWDDTGVMAGLGLTTPYGQSTEWSQRGDFPYFSEMRLVDISPALATRVGSRVSVGAAFNFYLSELKQKQMIFWSQSTRRRTDPDGSARMEGKGYGASGTGGVTWHVTPRQWLALMYQSRFDIPYEGDVQISNLPLGRLATLDMAGSFDTEIRFPSVAVLGYGIDLTDRIRLGADVEWVEFSRMETLPMDVTLIRLADQPPGPTPALEQNWDDVWTAGLAATWQCRDSLALRSTYKYFQSPIPGETFSPVFADSDKHLLAAGIGWTGGGHSLDLSYAYLFMDERDISGNVVPAFDGHYEFHSEIVEVTYRYDF